MSGNVGVSVIIVNRNGADHLRLCLPSLLSQSLKPLEIIVVDNDSSDESAEVAGSFGARWISLSTNMGLASGLNCGAQAALGDLLLFVNNDMKFDAEFVSALARPLARDEQLFATDAMQFNWDGTARRHMATRLTKDSDRSAALTKLVPGLYFYPQEETECSYVFMASAACMMARKTFFERLNGFDHRLPFGYEDVEICWRAWIHDWRTLYVPEAICWHRIGGSSRSLGAERLGFRGILKGRLIFATKLLSTRFAFRTWLVSAIGLAKDVVNLRWKCAFDRITVLISTFVLISALSREKKSLFNAGRSSPGKQLEAMLRLPNNEDSPQRL
jgi:GT2 family glycosyltransferase